MEKKLTPKKGTSPSPSRVHVLSPSKFNIWGTLANLGNVITAASKLRIKVIRLLQLIRVETYPKL